MQVALTVICPGGAPVVFRVAVLPLPETLPALAVQPLTVTGTLSGLVQVHVRFDRAASLQVVGLAEQDMVGRILRRFLHREVRRAAGLAALLHLGDR